ncbi:hypothetical protein F5B20DRAFT_537015 [Whalleya microplaca]|nr:hypothetical protein F5B20DRAFT_537015 [Whalleya microplaca]
MGNLSKADSKATTDDGPAPPPSYTETTQAPNADAHTLPTYDQILMNPVVSPYHSFPSLINAYYQWKITREFHLGEDRNQRLYCVSTHAGLTSRGPGKPGVILHNGPTGKHPMLAAAGEEPNWNIYSLNSIITLPPLPGSSSKMSTEIMRASTKQNTIRFQFSIEVGQGLHLRREDFEWRKSNGDEDKELVEPPWTCGFKLMRSSQHDGEGNCRTASGTSEAIANGSEEVLAVFAWSSRWSLTMPFKIQFRKGGLVDVMGERFTLMVIITALRLWGLKHQGRTSSSTVTSGEAGIVPGATG